MEARVRTHSRMIGTEKLYLLQRAREEKILLYNFF